jgi:hypothetical protein
MLEDFSGEETVETSGFERGRRGVERRPADVGPFLFPFQDLGRDEVSGHDLEIPTLPDFGEETEPAADVQNSASVITAEVFFEDAKFIVVEPVEKRGFGMITFRRELAVIEGPEDLGIPDLKKDPFEEEDLVVLGPKDELAILEEGDPVIRIDPVVLRGNLPASGEGPKGGVADRRKIEPESQEMLPFFKAEVPEAEMSIGVDLGLEGIDVDGKDGRIVVRQGNPDVDFGLEPIEENFPGQGLDGGRKFFHRSASGEHAG